MQYSIYKDANVNDTIKKIKKILAKNCIDVEEIITSEEDNKRALCPSVRIVIKNTHIGTNGKGISIENALASGYGEFMERLQNGVLVVFNSPDEQIVEKDSINQQILNFYPLNTKSKQVKVFPFYSLKDKKIINLPTALFQITNGFAAGNTIEEAFVQGLSEICERYALKNILDFKLSLPNIPQQEYMKYDNIKNIIDFYQNNDWEIHIKDASINKKLPVIFAVGINKKFNVLCLSFGAHPIFPVAIERTLTEMFQGLKIKLNESIKNNNQLYISKSFYEKYYENNPNKLLNRIIQKKLYIELNDAVIKQYIKNKSTFNFDINNWLTPANGITNYDLAKFLLKNIEKITKKEIYVRDVSFMGFPTLKIYIPSMSNICQLNAADLEKVLNLIHYYPENENKYTIEDLLYIIELGCEFQILQIIAKLPNEYIALLISIVLNDSNRIIKYSDMLLKENIKNKTIVKIIKEYYSYKQKNIEDYEIKNKLQKAFNLSDIKKFYIFISNLSFDVIKQIIKQNQTIIQNGQNLKKLEETLTDLYKMNIPNQKNLRGFFEFIS